MEDHRFVVVRTSELITKMIDHLFGTGEVCDVTMGSSRNSFIFVTSIKVSKYES